MWQTCKEFTRLFDPYYWKTAVLIAQNQLAKQYRNSFLGILWTLMQPLTMAGVYSLIMPLIMRFPQEDYLLFICCSLPLWIFISTTLSGASHSILAQGETLKRCMISSTVFPVADVLKAVYTFCISFLTMYTVASVIVWRFDPIVFLIPLYLLPVLVIVMALSVGIAFVAPYLRDVGEMILMSMNILFWLTPVLYPITAVPERFRDLMGWNPFYIMIHPVQTLAFTHSLPTAADTLRLLALMLLAIAAGYAVYRQCRRNYVYYL